MKRRIGPMAPERKATIATAAADASTTLRTDAGVPARPERHNPAASARVPTVPHRKAVRDPDIHTPSRFTVSTATPSTGAPGWATERIMVKPAGPAMAAATPYAFESSNVPVARLSDAHWTVFMKPRSTA